MTLSSRRRIFYSLVALFIVLGGGIALYAQGWRLDFTTWRFTKIGGIFVRSYPVDASISLNNKSVQNQSGFLSAGTLISDLLPRTYHVTLKADGYRDWEENAGVLPALVVQYKFAVMIPSEGVMASTTTSSIKQLTLLAIDKTASTTNPFDTNKKVVLGKNKISIFDINQATTTQSIATTGKIITTKWISGNRLGVLQSDNKLYLDDINANPGELKNLADDVRDFSTTNDGSMIAALEYKSLEVFSLNDSSIYYRFNVPNIAEAQRVIWYKDGTHLFVVYPNHVTLLDLADVSLNNFATVATGTKPLYDPKTNIFYITNASGSVTQFTFPS